MIITQHGIEFFKIQTSDTVLAFNPVDKKSSFKYSRFGADIALITLDHIDFNGVENLNYKDKKPFIVSGSGEYEIRNIFINGFHTKTNYGGKKESINTIYTVRLDGINICFLGALDNIEDVSGEIKDKFGEIDILFVPIGGEGVLNPSDAQKVSVLLSPKIVVPIHFDLKNKKEILSSFAKHSGSDMVAVDKLVIKKKDLLEKNGEVVLLNIS